MSASDFGFTMRPSRRDLVLVLSSDDLRTHLVQRLQEDGFSVISASTPEEAVALLQVARARAAIIGPHAGTFRSPHELPCVFVQGPEDTEQALRALPALLEG
jgi:hypothetical protein